MAGAVLWAVCLPVFAGSCPNMSAAAAAQCTASGYPNPTYGCEPKIKIYPPDGKPYWTATRISWSTGVETVLAWYRGCGPSCDLPDGSDVGEGITSNMSIFNEIGCDSDSFCKIRYEHDGSTTTFDGVAFLNVRMESTGQICGEDDPPASPPDDEECEDIGMGAIVCIRSPSETCVKTAKGNEYCWNPGEGGCEYGSNEAGCAAPGRPNPPDDYEPYITVNTSNTTTTNNNSTTSSTTSITIYNEGTGTGTGSGDDDNDGVPNEDEDDDGDGLPNGDDPDQDGDGLPNGDDPDYEGPQSPGDQNGNEGIANLRGCAAFTCVPTEVEGGAIACANARINWEHRCQLEAVRVTEGVGCEIPPTCSHPDPVQCAQLEMEWRTACNRTDDEEGSVGVSSCDAAPVCENSDPVACAILAAQHRTACALEIQVAGDGGCQNPPVCDQNDSVLCGQLLESWRNRCQLQASQNDGNCDIPVTCDTTRVECQQLIFQHKLTCGDGDGEWDDILDTQNDEGFGDEWEEDPSEVVVTEDGEGWMTEILAQEGFGAGQCPALEPVSIMGGVQLDLSGNGAFCDFLTLLRAMVLASAIFISGRILLGGMR